MYRNILEKEVQHLKTQLKRVCGGGEVWKRSDEFQNTLGYINVYVASSGKHTVKRYSL